MATEELDPDFVLVEGPNGRHIAVNKSTQEALPESFPLVKKSAPAAKKAAPAAKKPASAAETDASATVTKVDDEEGA